jgi:hypothetical protein
MNPAVVAVVDAFLELVKQGLAAIEAAKAGQAIDPSAVLANIPTLQDAIAQHNAAFATGEAAKFPAGAP